MDIMEYMDPSWYYDALSSFTSNILSDPKGMVELFQLTNIEPDELLMMNPKFTFSDFKAYKQTGIVDFTINLYYIQQIYKGEKVQLVQMKSSIPSNMAWKYLNLTAISLLYHDKIETEKIVKEEGKISKPKKSFWSFLKKILRKGYKTKWRE